MYVYIYICIYIYILYIYIYIHTRISTMWTSDVDHEEPEFFILSRISLLLKRRRRVAGHSWSYIPSPRHIICSKILFRSSWDPKNVTLVIKPNPHCLKMKLWLSNKNTRHRYGKSMILCSSSGNCLITDFASCFSAGCFPQTVGTLKADYPCMAVRDTPETGSNSHFWGDLMIHDS